MLIVVILKFIDKLIIERIPINRIIYKDILKCIIYLCSKLYCAMVKYTNLIKLNLKLIYNVLTVMFFVLYCKRLQLKPSLSATKYLIAYKYKYSFLKHKLPILAWNVSNLKAQRAFSTSAYLYDYSIYKNKFNKILTISAEYGLGVDKAILNCLKYTPKDTYMNIIDCCMNKSLKVNNATIKNGLAKFSSAESSKILKLIQSIRDATSKPNKLYFKNLNISLEETLTIEKPRSAYKVLGINKADLEYWYLLLRKETLYIPRNNSINSIWEIGEHDIETFALSCYNICLFMHLEDCRGVKTKHIPKVGLQSFYKVKNQNKAIESLMDGVSIPWGVFDFETTSRETEQMEVYAAGVKINDINKLFYGDNSVFDMIEYIWDQNWSSINYKENIIYWLSTNKHLIESKFKISDLIKNIREMEDGSSRMIVMIAHNSGRFDSKFIVNLHRNRKLDHKVNLIMRQNQIIFMDLIKGEGETARTIRIIDSLQHLKGSLEAIGDSYGIEQEKEIFPYQWYDKDKLSYIGQKPDLEEFISSISDKTKIEFIKSKWGNLPKLFNAKDYLNSYLIKDLEILNSVLSIYINNCININGINPIKYPGTPSYSDIVFKCNHLSHHIVTESYINETFIRKAYYGGRTEIFSFQSENGFINDINSSYPNSMLKEIPIGKGIMKTSNVSKKTFGFIRATVSCTSVNKIPILPVRYGGSLIFPMGEFTGVWFSEELNYAEECGYKIIRHQALEYKKSNKIFKSYVEKFYKIKTDSKTSTERSLAKLMLNSLYGKLGSRDNYNKVTLNEQNHLFEVELNINSNTKHMLRNCKEPGCIGYDDILQYFTNYFDRKCKWFCVINPNLALELKNDLRTNSVQLAAAITAYSRIALHKKLSQRNTHPLYCDTDSIISKNGIDKKSIHSNLGGWDEDIIKNINIPNNKMYSYDIVNQSGKITKQKYAFKGIKNTEIAKHCKNLIDGDIEYIISEELAFKATDFKITPTAFDKTTKLVYNKRAVINKEVLQDRATHVFKIDKVGEVKKDLTKEVDRVDKMIDTVPIMLCGYEEKEKPTDFLLVRDLCGIAEE